MEQMTTPFNDTTSFVPVHADVQEPTKPEKGISTASRKKKAQERQQDAGDELFTTNYAVGMGDMVGNVQELMARHPSILSMTKTGTKTMDQTFLRIRQLVAGEFMFAYTWDRPWFNKVSARWPVEKLRFNGADEVLDRLDDVLCYVEYRQEGGYWYPSKRNGKACRTSLANFIASPMRNGNWWSPFVDIACGDGITPRMYQEALGPKVCKAVHDCIGRAWWTCSFDNMVKFYKGVSDLKRWHDENRQQLVDRSSENAYTLSSFTSFLDKVVQCDREKGCTGPDFVGPWSPRWAVLKAWLMQNFGVTI